MQESFARLFQSSDLGIVIASPERIIDANDAFLRMVGYTRAEFNESGIDWRKLTPDEFVKLDKKAQEQLRTLGVAVPFERAFVCPDGRRIDVVIGAVRLSEEPFLWAAYGIDMTETRRLREAEHELRARTKVVNRLAHELNNPLAALTFILHLMKTDKDLPPGLHALQQNADEQLTRIADTVREVLDETRVEGK